MLFVCAAASLSHPCRCWSQQVLKRRLAFGSGNASGEVLLQQHVLGTFL
jgi:hypothetical protein